MLNLYCFDLRLHMGLRNVYKPSRMYLEVVAESKQSALKHASNILRFRAGTPTHTEVKLVSREVRPVPFDFLTGPLPQVYKDEVRDWFWKSGK